VAALTEWRPAIAAAASVAALLPLAACGGGDDNGATTRPHEQSANEAAAPATTTTRTKTTTPSSKAAQPPRCRTADLALSVNAKGAGGGKSFYAIVLRSKGDRACTLKGYPGVSMLDAKGRQIGRSAKRLSGGHPVRPVTLDPGGAGSAELTVENATCGVPGPMSKQVRVYPPDERRALVARTRAPACHPTIYPLQPGTHPS
jgi:hypothetical protein